MIRTQLHKQLFIVIALLTLACGVYGQYSSEEELKAASDDFFEKEQYVEALPLFSQLLSLYPKDLNYNYKYGACLLFATRDKEKSLKYLKFAASKSTVDPLAYYFLAKAHHYNYEFNPAIVYYNKFKGKADSKQLQKYKVGREIEMCENGKSLLKSMVDIGVLDKKEIKATDFFRSYALKGIGGKVIIKPDEFKSKVDIKKEETSLVYLGEKKDVVIYSSYGTDGKNGRDLFRVERAEGTDWSKPVSLGEGINTKYDEDYPFLHPDGKTLYFSSKGYNSMGGYDIFKSTYNAVTGKWSVPENLDFPINTPGDDILYISDIDNKLAYFASSRASKQGELTVYRVTVDPQPVKNSVIKGIFLAEQNPVMKSATITVQDVEKDKRYGTYKTNDASGEYMLMLPSNGGKYKILVETTSDAPIHSAIIDAPVLDEYRALKQELILVGEGENEKLVVKNLFDEFDEFDITDPLVVQNILKAKANLDVNTTEEEVLTPSLQTSLNNALEENKEEQSKYADLTDEELAEQVQTQTEKLINQAQQSRDQANSSYQIAQEKSAKAKALYGEALALYGEADAAINDVEKKEKRNAADEKKQEAARLINESAAIMNVARSVENEANERASDLSVIKAIKEKVSSGDRALVEEGKEKLDEIASATYQNESALTSEKDLAKKTYKEKEQAYKDEVRNVVELNSRKNDLITNINQLEEKRGSTKKKKEKEELGLQIETLKIDVEDAEFDLDAAKKRENNLYKDYVEAQTKYEATQDVIRQLEGGNISTAKMDDIEKLKIENNISYFEDEGLLGYYPPAEETTSIKVLSYNLEEHKDEYKIIDEEGKLIDYSAQYGAALADVDAVEDEEEKQRLITKVNKEWIASIDEEIEIRTNQLEASSNEGEKDELEGKITSLKTLRSEKQKEIDLLDTVVENTVEETDVPEQTTGSEGSDTNDEEITNYEDHYNEELSQLPEEDTYESYKQKASLHKKWAESIEKDIASKKSELAGTSDEDKKDLELKIAMLENNLQDQEEYVALYEMQAESVQPTTVEKEPVVSDVEEVEEPQEESTTEEKISIEEEEPKEVVEEIKEEPVAPTTLTDDEPTIEKENVDVSQYAIKEENLTVNNLNAEEDEFSNLKYNNKYEYKSQQSKKAMEEVAQLKSEAAELNEESEILFNSIENMTSSEEKEGASIKAEELKNQSYKKQDELASIYEEANRNEFYNNETTLSNFEAANKNPDSQAALMAGLLADESDIFYNQAKEKRKKAQSSSSFVSKEIMLQDAYELEMKAIEKQNQAIAMYLEEGGGELMTLVETGKTYDTEIPATSTLNDNIEENVETPTNVVETDVIGGDENVTSDEEIESSDNIESTPPQEVVENNSVTPEKRTIDNTTTSATGDVEPFEVYEPLTIAMPSAEVEEEARSLEEEAAVLKAEAKALTDSAATVKKKKEREPIIAKATELTEEADRKIKEAEVLYAQVEEMKVEEEALLNDLSENRAAVANEKITSEETDLITNLSPTEIKETRDSEDYQSYANAKKETRRLIKEAQVEYIEADKVQEEADDQKTLEISLNAMLAAAETEEDKEKKRGQIEKLKGMIEENETKATELRKSATEKEKQALENNKKSDEILANSEMADQIKAIEKVETYNSSLLEKATPTSDELASNTTVDDELPKDEVVVEETPVVETEIEQPTVEEQPIVDEEESTFVEETTPRDEPVTINEASTTPANIDEIPEVLEESIFVLNNNQAEYSDDKPIPVSPKLPEGLVFKVQIGAFRNPIPQSHFKGFAPIMAEDAGNGITRYTAGFFKKFNTANEAKSDIRSIGYSDAFVVAFLNGERINISKARAMEAGGEDVVASNESQDVTPVVANTTEESTSAPDVTPVNTPPNTPVREEVKDGVSTDVRNIDGVFYTIQVGVYSKPITSGQLNNLTPINSERIQNGLIRYTSGVHKSLDEANADKDRIRNLGISDAFIIAYNGGSRISVTQAKELLGGSNNASSNSTPPQREEPQEEVINEELPVEEDHTPVEESETIMQKVDVRYKVQLGEYEEEVPIEDAGIFLQLTGRGVKIHEENGKTIYTIGSYPDYQSAIDTQIEMKEMGVKTPKVIAYKENVLITVEEALEIQKNN